MGRRFVSVLSIAKSVFLSSAHWADQRNNFEQLNIRIIDNFMRRIDNGFFSLKTFLPFDATNNEAKLGRSFFWKGQNETERKAFAHFPLPEFGWPDREWGGLRGGVNQGKAREEKNEGDRFRKRKESEVVRKIFRSHLFLSLLRDWI
jgi:hypothetical protein